MQKFVKFRFTLSALSAMEYIYGLHSDLRRRSVIINGVYFWSDCKGLNMKSYTLTWRHSPFYGSTLSRCRFEPNFLAWPSLALKSELLYSPILAFMYVCCRPDHGSSRSYRLSSCGRLVARSATYQGV